MSARQLPPSASSSCTGVKPRIGQKVECWRNDERFTRTVISRAGKTTGRNSNCLNVELGNGKVQWFDFSCDKNKWNIINEVNETLSHN